MTFLAQFQAGAPVKHTPDTETFRVVNLPEHTTPSTDLTYLLRRPEWPQSRDAEIPEQFRNLRPIQSQALCGAIEGRGALLLVGVGGGKTMIALLSGAVLDAEFLIVVTPSQTKSGMLGVYFEMRKYYRTPAHVEIIATEDLQQPRTTDLLKDMLRGHDADGVVLAIDEAHAFKAIRTSARAKRLLRFVREYHKIPVVAMSGTLMSASLTDVSHIAEMCLHAGSPLPRDRSHLEAWAQIIDPKGGKPGPTDWATFRPLWDWYRARTPGIPDMGSADGMLRLRIARRAFSARLACTRGVVRSTESMIKAKLVIHGRDIPLPPETTELLERATVEREDPEHEPIPDDVTRWRLERQIAQGFHYRWAWERTPGGIEDKDWLRARSDWNRHVRFELGHSHTGYDSPKLVYDVVTQEILGLLHDPVLNLWAKVAALVGKDITPDEIDLHDPDSDLDDSAQAFAAMADPDPKGAKAKARQDILRQWADVCQKTGICFDDAGARASARLREPIHKAWCGWSVQKRKDPPPTEPVWHSPFLVLDAVAWAKSRPEPVAIWFSDEAVGAALEYMGLQVYGAGDIPPQYPTRAKTAAYSIRAHGIGKNLQNYRTMLVLSPPAGAETWEQLLGRLHRPRAPGDDVDHVDCYVYTHTDSNLDALHKARKAACAVEDNTDNQQKLVHAEYFGIPVQQDVEITL